MLFVRRNLCSLLWIILLWRFGRSRAYVDVCEYSPMAVYCDCEELSYRESSSLYRVTCLILQSIKETDSVWRSLGDAENISYLKLQPRLPLKLEYIPSDDLRRMPRLRMLKIQEGALGTLKSYAVSGYENLEELELEGNDIEALEPNAISNMPKLKKLTLSGNSLNELLANSLSDLLALEILFLDRNNISRIETCAFCNLQNLKELEMWGNRISDLTEYTFRGLRYLKRLDLYKNNIRILNDKVFHTMPRLVEIDLRENMISHVSARAFVGLDKLQTLNLGNNMIKALPDEVFAPLLGLRFVDLYHNHLEVLQREVVDGLKNSNYEHFSLAFKENPYRCDCGMDWVASYLKDTKSYRFTRELEAVKCRQHNETTKILEYLETTDCEKPAIDNRPSSSASTVTKLVMKSTESVPVELNSQKNKPELAAASVPTDETYLSDVVNDKSSSHLGGDEDGRDDDSGSLPDSGRQLNAHSVLVLCIGFLTFVIHVDRVLV